MASTPPKTACPATATRCRPAPDPSLVSEGEKEKKGGLQWSGNGNRTLVTTLYAGRVSGWKRRLRLGAEFEALDQTFVGSHQI